MNKAIILDRDGVINIERGTYTWRLEDFKYMPGLREFLETAKQKGYILLSITNQSGIAKGIYSVSDFERIREKILRETKEWNTPILEMLYCPHHPEVSKCLCRKPLSLLYEKLIAKYDLEVTNSWMLGDKERDLIPAKKLGMQTMLIGNGKSKFADIKVKDLTEARKRI